MMYSSARINSILFYLLWTCAPTLISVLSFFTFVMLGNELTVSVAFTVRSNYLPFHTTQIRCQQAIVLFNMVRYVGLFSSFRISAYVHFRIPLNVIPAWIVQILQVKFSLSL